MALAYVENPELVGLREPQAPTAPIEQLHSSEMRSFYLDDGAVHKVFLDVHEREEGGLTVVSMVKSFEPNGQATEPWRILSSSQFLDRRHGGLYVQAQVQPKRNIGRIGISWLRVFEDPAADGLFAAPNAMPRTMKIRHLRLV